MFQKFFSLSYDTFQAVVKLLMRFHRYEFYVPFVKPL